MRQKTITDFKSLFESAPGLYLILLPDLTIVAASDAYLSATMTKRKNIVGKGLFEVFPDNPDDPSATGVTNLHASLNYVLQHKTAHTMAVLKYDIRRPDGRFEERFWSPLNKPVLNDKNEIAWIIHRVEDVTEFIRLKKEELKQIEHTKDLKRQVVEMEIETYKRAQEIEESNKKLLNEIKERKRLEEQLKKINEELEEQVKSKVIEISTTGEQLKESEEKYRTIFYKSPLPKWIYDLETLKFLEVNERAVELYGYSQEEFLNMTIKDIRPKEDLPLLFEDLEKIRPAAVTRHGSWRHLKKNGEPIIVETTAHSIDYNGKMVRMVVANDITEQTKAEKLIRNAEANYREIFDKASDAIYVHEIESGQVIEVNQRATEITGFSKEELINSDPHEFITDHPDYTFEHAVKYLQKAAGGQPQTFEWLGKKKDGAANWFEVSLKRATIAGEERILAFFREINERKKAQRELAAERNLLRSLIDNLPVFIYVKDTASRYIIANKALVDIVDAGSEKEILGKTVLDLFDPEIAPVNFEEDKKIFELGEFSINREESITKKAGQKLWLLTSKVPLKDENNKIIGLIGISRDITERKHTEILLEQMNESLEKRAAELSASNTELERFAYVASHDLQEPLRMVSSFLELLQKKLGEKLDDTGKQYIHFAVDGAERMKKLIQDLLEYSRVGTTKENMIEVDCNEMVNSVCKILALSIHDKKAKLNIRPLPVITAVKAQMQQLFQNLIGNALKYSGDKIPEIEIGCNDKGKTWEFYVKDNGIGMESKFFEKIFVIFQRLHNRSEYSGTGIGLAICKKIVEKHNGKIWVESELGKGSTFFVELPKTK